MHLARDNDVVHTLAPDRPDQSFGKAIVRTENLIRVDDVMESSKLAE